jgi:hypothetical protein
MNRAYAIKHWGFTLLLAPFISQAIQYIWEISPDEVVGLLEIYPLTLLFSIIFSIPTFSFYLICLYLLSKHKINTGMSKLILITVTILGIFITQILIEGTMTKEIIIAYSVTAIITGLALRLNESKIIKQDAAVTT